MLPKSMVGVGYPTQFLYQNWCKENRLNEPEFGKNCFFPSTEDKIKIFLNTKRNASQYSVYKLSSIKKCQTVNLKHQVNIRDFLCRPHVTDWMISLFNIQTRRQPLNVTAFL